MEEATGFYLVMKGTYQNLRGNFMSFPLDTDLKGLNLTIPNKSNLFKVEFMNKEGQ